MAFVGALVKAVLVKPRRGKGKGTLHSNGYEPGRHTKRKLPKGDKENEEGRVMEGRTRGNKMKRSYKKRRNKNKQKKNKNTDNRREVNMKKERREMSGG